MKSENQVKKKSNEELLESGNVQLFCEFCSKSYFTKIKLKHHLNTNHIIDSSKDKNSRVTKKVKSSNIFIINK